MNQIQMADDGVTYNDGPPLSAWEPWTPEQAAGILAGAPCDWCVVGGWAIDLFLGERSRDHEDLEIAIVRADLPLMREHLKTFRLHAVGDGEIRRLAVDEVTPADRHQNWVLDVQAGKWRMDVMLEPGDADTWIFRRQESIRAPRNRMIDRSGPVPYLRPEGVLLYKAKAHRDKDEQDLANCLPHLVGDARSWLREAIEKVHPQHDWLKVL